MRGSGHLADLAGQGGGYMETWRKQWEWTCGMRLHN